MFERYAIYYTFDGAMAHAGAAWLGWDIATGDAVQYPEGIAVDLATIAARPRKYGFHATIKAPFYLKETTSAQDLQNAFTEFCAKTPAARAQGLQIKQLGRLFALVPIGDETEIKSLAAHCVQTLDCYRAPLSAHDLKRRLKPHMSDQQRANLHRWGYPNVMEDFRFHVTLSNPLHADSFANVSDAAKAQFDPHLPAPFTVSHLTLAGARADGLFQQISRVALTG